MASYHSPGKGLFGLTRSLMVMCIPSGPMLPSPDNLFNIARVSANRKLPPLVNTIPCLTIHDPEADVRDRVNFSSTKFGAGH